MIIEFHTYLALGRGALVQEPLLSYSRKVEI